MSTVGKLIQFIIILLTQKKLSSLIKTRSKVQIIKYVYMKHILKEENIFDLCKSFIIKKQFTPSISTG